MGTLWLSRSSPLILSIYGITRGVWSSHARKEARRLQRLVEEIGRLAELPDEDL